MIPSTALGLVLFIVLLGPGLAYVLRHERVIPAAAHSAFRETLRVVFVSVLCLTVTGLLMTGLQALMPTRTPDVRAIVQDPDTYIRSHHVEVAWWALGFVAVATLIGFVAADPRVVRRTRKARTNRFWRKLLGETSISPSSAWRKAMIELRDDVVMTMTQERATVGRTHIGAQMTDGTYVRGYLVSASPETKENDERELILTRAEVIAPNGKKGPAGSHFAVISARNISRLDISHIKPVPVVQPPTRLPQDSPGAE